jgi:hypothetical protein
VLRASAGFILDQVRLGRGPLGFLDALILVAITQANVDLLQRDPELNRQYATYDQVPPDSLRRPISINAVSQSLGVPFETARRRVARLAAARLCNITPAGVIVPSPVVKLGSHKAAAEANCARTRALYLRLADLRLAPEPPDAAPWSGPAPLRAVARASSDYLLRVIAAAGASLGDVVSTAIWLEILRSTHEQLADEAGLCPDRSSPVSVSAVAKRIGLPTENVRRRVADFTERGLCERTGAGVVLARDTPHSPEMALMLRDNHRDLNRMFAALGQLGILASWRTGSDMLPPAAHEFR